MEQTISRTNENSRFLRFLGAGASCERGIFSLSPLGTNMRRSIHCTAALEWLNAFNQSVETFGNEVHKYKDDEAYTY